MSGPRWAPETPSFAREAFGAVARHTGKQIVRKLRGKKRGLRRWTVDVIGILWTTKRNRKQTSTSRGGGSAPTGRPSQEWQTAAPRATPNVNVSVNIFNIQGGTGMSEINGVASYVQALDKCAEAPEDMLAQAEARLAEAQAASESEHDNGAAQELADAWRTVVEAIGSAGESSTTAAAQAHQEYDSVIEALSGINAPAAQQYLGDN